MRPRHAATATALLLAALAGCASVGSSVNTAAQNTTAAQAPSGAPAQPAKAAGVGDSISVKGFSGEQVTVQLVKLFPDAKGADEYTTPDAGKQFYAAQLRITNSGSKAYSDSPDNSVTLKDASGQQFQSDLSDVTAGQSFGQVNIAPGDSVLGVVVFQVPAGDKVVRLQFTPDSGMASDTAQWNLP